MKQVKKEALLSEAFRLLDLDLSDSISSNEAASRLHSRMRKRAAFQKPELIENGLLEFEELNESLSKVRVNLDPIILNEARLFISYALEKYTRTLDEDGIQESLHTLTLFENWRFGPGASHGLDCTHTVEKLEREMLCTADAELFVVNVRRMNPYFFASDGERMGPSKPHLRGSKITSVFKNETSVRIIAVEPPGNMCMQLAAGRYLEEALRCIGLDIRNQQDKNKLLAMVGSCDNSNATIDLKKASDRQLIELIELLFPREWFSLLMKLRSPEGLINGKWVKLNMMSTMGNGFTFPLMTLVLTALCYANNRVNFNGRRNFIDWKRFAVFGDDIIVPREQYSSLCVILEGAGYMVNHDKSYSDGPFRESCGGDYMNGVNITPFYIKSLSTTAERYVAINQLLLWMGTHEIPCYRLLRYLFALTPQAFLIPEWHNTCEGVLTSQVSRKYKYLSTRVEPTKVDPDYRFSMMAACGGYVESDKDGTLFYTSRFGKSVVKVRRARIPQGYADGWSPDRATAGVSARIALYVSLV